MAGDEKARAQLLDEAFRDEEIAHAKKMIKLLGAALEGQATDDVRNYELATETGRRRIEKIPMKELKAIRDSYIRRLSELDNRPRSKARRILMRF